MTDRRTWALICAFALMLLILVLCGISFGSAHGATGPQEYLYRAFVRQHALSDSSLYVDGSAGDIVRCFSVSLTDTTGNGVDQTYTSDVRHNWRFAMPDSAQICDCYEVAGSPDSLLWYHVRLPGKGFRIARNQLTTDAQGRWDPHVTIKVDTLYAAKRITATDAVLGSGTIGNGELAADAVDASKIAADAVGTSEIAADGVGASEIAASAVGTSEIADGTVADGDLAGSISLSKLSNASASTNDVIAYNGSAWAKVSTLATPISTTTITASGATTLNGAVTLGDAAGDAITSTGNFTATGTTACGNDTTDVATVRGQPRWPDAIVCASFDSGTAIDTFTFTNAKAGWHYTAMFQDTNGKTIKSVYRSASNTVTVETGTAVTVASTICIWGWKP